MVRKARAKPTTAKKPAKAATNKQPAKKDPKRLARALAKALEANDLVAAQDAIDAGANPKVRDEKLVYPVWNCRSREMMELLFRHGADIDAPHVGKKHSMLSLYCGTIERTLSDESRDTAMWLLDRGADPNHASSYDKTTPLHRVASTLDRPLFEALVARGAKPTVDKAGETPLMIAMRYTNDPAAWDKLLAIGDSLEGRNKAGESARDIATKHANASALAWLDGKQTTKSS